LEAASWTRGYAFTERDGRPFYPGGQFIMSRFPIEKVSASVLVGRQGRTALFADLLIDGQRFVVATSHMESPLEAGQTRARQLAAIFDRLRAAPHALFLGDMNFGDGARAETAQLDASYLDVWRVLHPKKAGFTWNNDGNPLARLGAFEGEPNRRLDRMLLKSPSYQPRSIAIIGDRSAGLRKLTADDRAMIEMPGRGDDRAFPPAIEVFPSDHYGLAAVIAK
jgi:endonuclease/exonuclease/phosphatase family metal-dependent hydrolase